VVVLDGLWILAVFAALVVFAVFRIAVHRLNRKP
jgi:hypothetical protein